MDITLDCSISLSKKLRSLFGDEEVRIVLIADPVRAGRGRANLIVSSEKIDMSAVKDLLNQETSLMLTPLAEKQEDISTTAITGLFCGSPTPSPKVGTKRSPIDRLAVTEAPEKKNVAHAIKTREEIVIPEEFSEIQDPDYKNFVSNFDELMVSLRQAQTKDSGIDLDAIKDARQRAIAKEAKERAEAIDLPAYIVIEKCAAVRINDMDISLMQNVPYNLSNISAKRVMESRELRSLINSGIIKFIRPDEVESYKAKAQGEVEKATLDTFSNHKEAERAIESHIPSGEEVEISVSEIDRPTEQEQLVTNLTPISSDLDSEDGHVRITNYSMGQPRVKKNVPETAVKNKSGLSSIRRTGIEYK